MKCKQCGRTIRSDSRLAIHLYATPTGDEYVCGQTCLDVYNDASPDDLKDCPCGAHP